MPSPFLRSRRLLPSFALVAAVAGCASTEDQPPVDRRACVSRDDIACRPAHPTAPRPAAVAPSPDLTPAAAEAAAVATLVSFGTAPEELASHHVGHLLARDLNGEPFVYLVFTAPTPAIREPLTFEAPGATHTSTVVTGASSTRGGTAFVAHDLGLLVALQVSVAAAGGRDRVDAIVAASPTELFVKTKDGRYFASGQTQAIAPELEAKLRADWASANATPEATAAREASREAWRLRVEGDASIGHDAPRGTIDDVTLADGNLDLPRAVALADLRPFFTAVRSHLVDAKKVESLRATRPGFAGTSQDNCWGYWFFGWHTVCDVIEQGGFSRPESQQAHREIQSRGYEVPTCGPLETRWLSAGVDGNAFAGCGPSSAVSLIWRAWLEGEPFKALEKVSRQSAGRYDAWSYADGFERLVNTPMIEDMSSCSDGARGTTTYHWDFVNGANAWLARNGSSYRMKNVWSLPPFHGLDANRKAALLHERIGVQEKPMVAAFDTELGSHFAPVAEYRLVRHPNPLQGTDVYVRGLDEGQSTNRWYLVSHPWSIASALYWLER